MFFVPFLLISRAQIASVLIFINKKITKFSFFVKNSFVQNALNLRVLPFPVFFSNST